VSSQTRKRFGGQVQPTEGWERVLQVFDDTNGMRVMVEAAHSGHGFVECGFAGVAERRVSEIVRQGDCLSQ
jgi:hypothetical protein